MLKVSQFENNDKRLPLVILYPIENGYIYFDNYRVIGTDLNLYRGDRKVSILRLNSEKRISLFKKEFDKITSK